MQVRVRYGSRLAEDLRYLSRRTRAQLHLRHVRWCLFRGSEEECPGTKTETASHFFFFFNPARQYIRQGSLDAWSPRFRPGDCRHVRNHAEGPDGAREVQWHPELSIGERRGLWDHGVSGGSRDMDLTTLMPAVLLYCRRPSKSIEVCGNG